MKKFVIAVSVIFGLYGIGMADEGADLYKKCAMCHGLHGEKSALGKSKIIKDLGVAGIINALKGYKNGTYGGAMKGMMKGQTLLLSDAQITAIATHIAK